MTEPIRHSSHIRGRSAGILLCLVIASLLGLAGRLVHINVARGADLRRLAHQQQASLATIPARRGMILDSRGRVVASSEELPDVFIDPSRVEDPSDLANILAPRLNLSAESIVETVLARRRAKYALVLRQADAVTAEAVRSLRHPAVGLSYRAARTYPLGESMAHVIGWVGRDGHGLEGLELAFDQHLRGEKGRRSAIRDARRRALGVGDSPSLPPTDGGHIVLTIDAEVQRIVEERLSFHAERVAAESGVAIVMSPRSGEILGMACWPMFDLNDAATTPSELRRNRTITDPVEPGSTFKPFVVVGALEGNFVSPTEKFDCHNGEFYFGSRLVTDTKPYGLLDLKGIIAKSSNIGMGQIAERMGNPVVRDTVLRFGFGSMTGIELPGESDGLVFPLRRWGEMSTQSVAMGYEVMVTPLQLVRGFAAFVNGGRLLQPRVVKQVLGPEGDLLESFQEPRIIGEALGRSTAHYIASELLTAVVEEGGGGKARARHYRVLGKTGTAKLTYRDRPGYEPGAYLGTFVGAAPVSDPQIVTLVMLQRPSAEKGYYGGAIAAPAVGEIIENVLSYLCVPPDITLGELSASRPL